MRHRSLTFCSLRHDISQKLGPHTAALSAGSCSWGPLAELWMGSMLDPERRVMRLPARGSSVLSLLAHTTVTASLRYWQFPFSRSQDDKSDHSLSFPEMETANTSASNHKVSTWFYQVCFPHPRGLTFLLHCFSSASTQM